MAMSRPLEMDTVSCDLCDSNTGVKWFCAECDRNMCSGCTRCHSNIPNCREHKLHPHDDNQRSSPDKTTEEEEEGDEKQISDESDCRRCPSDNIEGETAESQEAKARLLMETLQKLQEVRKAIRDVEQCRTNYSANVERQIEAVKQRTQEMKEQLDTEQNRLINGLNDARFSARQMINNEIGKLENRQNEQYELEHIASEFEAKCNDENVDVVELIDFMEKSSERLDAMESGPITINLPSLPEVQFSDAISEERISQTFGSLQTNEPTILTTGDSE